MEGGGLGEMISNSVPWMSAVFALGISAGVVVKGAGSRCGDLVGLGGGVLTGIERAVTKLAGDPAYSDFIGEKPGVEGEGGSRDLEAIAGDVEGVEEVQEDGEGSARRRDLDRISTSLFTLPIGLPAPSIESACPTTTASDVFRVGVETGCGRGLRNEEEEEEGIPAD